MGKTPILHGLYQSIALVLCVVVLVGCAMRGATSAGYPPKPDLLNPSGTVVSLLIYFDTMRKLPPAELARATEQARKRYASKKSDVYRLQYALALAVPGADARHAQQLLEPLTKETAGHDHALHALAVLVYTGLVDRRRLEGGLQAQTQRAEALESQLEALKNIEKNMLQRENPAKGKP